MDQFIDLTGTDLVPTCKAIARFWLDAIHTDREEMRRRWKANRYEFMPRALAAAIMEGR